MNHKNNITSEIDEAFHAKDWSRCVEIIKTLKAPEARHLNLKGACHEQLNDFESALCAYEFAINTDKRYAKAHFNIGRLSEEVDIGKAIKYYEHAVTLNQENETFLLALGLAYEKIKKIPESFALLSAAILLHPNDKKIAGAYVGACRRNGEKKAAIAVIERILKEDPEDEIFLQLLGEEQTNSGKAVDAITTYKNLIKAKPQNPFGYFGLAKLYQTRTLYNKALATYRSLLDLQAIKEDKNLRSIAYEMVLFNSARACDYATVETYLKKLTKIKKFECKSPFMYLSVADDPSLVLRTNRLHAETYKTKSAQVPSYTDRRISNKKKRIGYISGDFYNHAMMHLMIELFKNHDRGCFEVICISIGNVRDETTKNVKRLCDRYHDIESLSFSDRVDYIRDLHLDYAVDLVGYTKDSDPAILMARVAPVQINFLGYPSTSGMENVDYIVADRYVIPEKYDKYYSEKVIRLENSYQPNNENRGKKSGLITRSAANLPEDKFVFGNFNQAYKITKDVIVLWSRILRKVANSVLWLLEPGHDAKANLIKEFERQNINTERLIFAKRVSVPEHLSRHEHMDLCLDTLIYNAHTTGSDALWYGVPMITKPGKIFASRVGSSLVSACGLDELIVSSEDDYVAVAVKLATNRSELERVKNVLGKFNLTHPLFNNKRWTQDFEKKLNNVFVDRIEHPISETNISLNNETSDKSHNANVDHKLSRSHAFIRNELQLKENIRVIDLGAATFNEAIGYERLIDLELATVVGFEPNNSEFDRLRNDSRRQFLNHAVGDGKEVILRECVAPGMNSFLEPDLSWLSKFPMFEKWSEVLKEHKLSSVRLDDLHELKGSHFLKIDVQGFEQKILECSTELLKSLCVLQIEASPVPLYKGERNLFEIGAWLYNEGWILNKFFHLNMRKFKPMGVDERPYEEGSQLLQVDAVFYPHPLRWKSYSVSALKIMGILFHEVYQSNDLAMLVFDHIDAREQSSYAKLFSTYLLEIQPSVTSVIDRKRPT